MKYAVMTNYAGGGYNFDSSDSLNELIDAAKQDVQADDSIDSIYVGEADDNGLYDNTYDPIWCWTREQA